MSTGSEFKGRIMTSERVVTAGGKSLASETHFRKIWRDPSQKIDIVHSETKLLRLPGTELPSLSFRGELYPGSIKTLENMTPDEPSQYNALVVETFEDFNVVDLLIDGKSQLDTSKEVEGRTLRPGTEDHVRFRLDTFQPGQKVSLRVHNVGHDRSEFRGKLVARPVEDEVAATEPSA
jgi:hypothetical protein